MTACQRWHSVAAFLTEVAMRNLYWIGLAVVLLSGCGDDGLEGEKLSLNSLNGTYEAAPECSVTVAESQVSASNCQTGGFLINGNGTLSDTDVSASGTAIETRSLFSDCYGIQTCTTSVSGSASKNENRSEDGPFSSFAGGWNGSVTFETTCVESEPTEEFPDFCVEPSETTSTVAYTFDIDIFGRTADLSYSGEERGDAQIVGTENAIEVDGERFDKI